jgi:hypothetical protein
MITVTLQIGNSDNKLTQQEWHEFALWIGGKVRSYASEVYFNGASNAVAPWQNAAWVFDVEEAKIEELKYYVKDARRKFKQDSVAWTEGTTTFL